MVRTPRTTDLGRWLSVAGRAVVTVLVVAAIATPASAADRTLGPPLIAESFTPLACSANTTLGMEGCAEARLLRADHVVNRELTLIFRFLHSANERRTFDRAETTWSSYRRTACLSVAALYAGGTIAPIEFADCEVSADWNRSRDLHFFYVLAAEGQRAPAWPG